MELNIKISIQRVFAANPELQSTLHKNVKDTKGIEQLASLSGVSSNFLDIHSDELQRLLWSLS